jgi:hypothetical protein
MVDLGMTLKFEIRVLKKNLPFMVRLGKTRKKEKN